MRFFPLTANQCEQTLMLCVFLATLNLASNVNSSIKFFFTRYHGLLKTDQDKTSRIIYQKKT